MAAKEFIEPVFDLKACKKELRDFHDLLESQSEFSEREIHSFFKAKHQLTLLFGWFSPEIVAADQIGFEFQVGQDYVADIVVGNKVHRSYCLVELEDAASNSLFSQAGRKATKEWGRRFEHGFSQLVDWFQLLDDVKNTNRFAKDFGYGHVSWEGILIVGRSTGLTDTEKGRLKWCANRVTINTHRINCMTYDDLYEKLNRQIGYYSAASGDQVQ